MAQDIPDDLIEIRDTSINPDEIMSEIKRRIMITREELGYEKRNFPRFGVVDCPLEPTDGSGDQELYFYLRAINREGKQEDSIEAVATVYSRLKRIYLKLLRVPILGPIITRIRTKFLHIINHSVSQSMQEYRNKNRDHVNVLNRLVALNQQQQQQIVELETKLNHLISLNNKTN